MPQETEIKLRIVDKDGFLAALERIGAKEIGIGRVFEENVVFDRPDKALANQRHLLRIRTETPQEATTRKAEGKRFRLTFKRPSVEQRLGASPDVEEAGYKVREEIEVELTEAAVLSRIFEGLGMKPWFRYEKYRTTYEIDGSRGWGNGLLIEVDELPIGVFAELEGPPEAIDRAAAELGFSKQDYIVRNYFALYMEECRRRGEKPGDMVFRSRTKGID